MSNFIQLLLFFQIKHLICDFPLQAHPYMYKNKGIYGHFGGILHAAIHMIGSTILCQYFGLSLWLAYFDGIIHYHIDFVKMWINNHFKLKPDNSEYFWILLGIDQFLHQITYIGIIWLSTFIG